MLFSMTPPRVALVVSSTAGAEVTVTVSVWLPALSATFRPRLLSASTTRFSCLKELNPGAETVSVYVPGMSGDTL
jgi:hypothetical protein